MENLEILKSIDTKLTALIGLLVEKRETTDKKEKPQAIEVLLSRLGLTNKEIAAILNKNLGAVQKAIQRGKQRGN